VIVERYKMQDARCRIRAKVSHHASGIMDHASIDVKGGHYHEMHRMPDGKH
jgi:hypothetical protein